MADRCMLAVTEESDRILETLTESFDKNDYGEVTYRLRKLQELRKGIENPTHQFLQRVSLGLSTFN